MPLSILRFVLGVGTALVLIVLAISPAHAQIPVASPRAPTATARGLVLQAAPIFILPDPKRIPLRVAAVGTDLEVLGGDESWLHVRFQDPELGARVGYMETKFVRTETPPGVEPMDLSVPRGDPAHVDPPAPSPSAAPPTRTPARRGWWANVGLGFGSGGCQDCDGLRFTGLTEQLGVGGTINPHLQLGVGSDGWAHRDNFGNTESVGILDARLRYYPSRRAGFFVTGGVGLGVYRYLDETETGLGLLLGVGWDVPVGTHVSLTPFWQGYAMANARMDANVGQLGLGLTIH
jgi:hypothetical protein